MAASSTPREKLALSLSSRVSANRRPSGDQCGVMMWLPVRIQRTVPWPQVEQADPAGAFVVDDGGGPATGRGPRLLVPAVGGDVPAALAIQGVPLPAGVPVEVAPVSTQPPGSVTTARVQSPVGAGTTDIVRGAADTVATGVTTGAQVAVPGQRESQPDVRPDEGDQRRDGAPGGGPCGAAPQPSAPPQGPVGEVGRRPGLGRDLPYGGTQDVLPGAVHRTSSVTLSSRTGTNCRSLASALDVWLATVPARQPSSAAVCSTLRSSR